jgi:membrane protein DedA with SNARE-associated domain
MPRLRSGSIEPQLLVPRRALLGATFVGTARGIGLRRIGVFQDAYEKVGVEKDYLLGLLLASLTGLSLSRTSAPCVGHVGGSLGTLIEADVLNLGKTRDLVRRWDRLVGPHLRRDLLDRDPGCAVGVMRQTICCTRRGDHARLTGTRESQKKFRGLHVRSGAMEDFIARYGLFGILLGAVFEGDVTMILAGVVAHLGLVSPMAAVGVGACGAMLSDVGFYLAGRYSKPRIERSTMYVQARPILDRLVGRFGAWQVLVARFVYGTRVASMLFWGMRVLPWHRFVLLDSLACALWAGALVVVGFSLSANAAVLIGDVKKTELWLLGALLIGVAIVVSLRAMGRRLRAA